MRIPVPVEVTGEEEQLVYCHVYRQGYLDITKPRRKDHGFAVRDSWPEAYDAGQAAAYKLLSGAWAWR